MPPPLLSLSLRSCSHLSVISFCCVRYALLLLSPQGNMRQKVLSGRLNRGYNPVYWNDSVAVGTVASERNTIATCIYWLEQEKLKQEGKPHVYVDAEGEV